MITLHKGAYQLGISPSERSVGQLLANCIVPLDKPCGPSSHEANMIIRRLAGAAKSGHAGTLDPNVSGVLPVLLGGATKVSKLLTASGKEYVCLAKFAGPITEEQLQESLMFLQGEIYQTPPKESAVRKQLRTRKVYETKIIEHDGDSVLFCSRVQAGTYIRTLVRDAGILAGCGAEMAELRRTVAAGIPLAKCVTIHEFSDRLWLYTEHGIEEPIRKCLLPPEDVLRLKRAIIADVAIKPVCAGSDIAVGAVDAIDGEVKEGQLVGVFSGKGSLVCIARSLHDAAKVKALDSRERLLDTERMLWQG